MSVNLSPVGGVADQFFDNNGVPLSGGQIFSYAAGTTTPVATYTSSTGLIAHANPIILDAAGRVPGGEIWVDSFTSYKFVIKTATSVLIGTYDNILANTANNIFYNEGCAGAVSRTVSSKLQESVSVKDFGAVGNGVTDDTAAIQAAYNCVAAVHGILHFPEGNYICSGLDLGTGSLSCTFQGDAYDGKGAIGNISQITLKNNSNRSLFTILAINEYRHTFKNLVFIGNKDNQTSGGYLIHVNDNIPSIGYRTGIQLEDVHFVNGYSGGLYVGRNRGANVLNQVTTYNCGTTANDHGIYINSYDVFMSDCHLGNSFGYGLYADFTSQLQIFGCNTYFNKAGGVYIGNNVVEMSYLGGTIDRNEKHGLTLVARTDANWEGIRLFSGIQFLGNSSSANNVYSDVSVEGADIDTKFIGCSWQRQPAVAAYPKHYIYFNNSSASVGIIGSRFATLVPGYITSLTNSYVSINSADMPNFSYQLNSATSTTYKAGVYDALVLNSATGSVGVGGASFTGASFRVTKPLTGNVISSSIVSDGVIQSDATSAAYSFLSAPTTAAAVFNTNAIVGYIAKFDGFGAGSTANNIIGFNAENSLVGANNSVGFKSNIDSGSNRFNFLAEGTAQNYFAGTIASLGSYTSTTGAGVNVSIDSFGLIQRSTSSSRYKTDIEQLKPSYADNLLFGVRPVWYRSTCDGDNKNWSWYGFIAEEVAAIDPRLVHWGYPQKTIQEQIEHPSIFNEDGSIAKESWVETIEKIKPDTDAPLQAEGVMYDRMVVMLFDIVKRQDERIKILEAKDGLK